MKYKLLEDWFWYKEWTIIQLKEGGNYYWISEYRSSCEAVHKSIVYEYKGLFEPVEETPEWIKKVLESIDPYLGMKKEDVLWDSLIRKAILKHMPKWETKAQTLQWIKWCICSRPSTRHTAHAGAYAICTCGKPIKPKTL